MKLVGYGFAGDVNKPSFDEVYQRVKKYLQEILPEE